MFILKYRYFIDNLRSVRSELKSVVEVQNAKSTTKTCRSAGASRRSRAARLFPVMRRVHVAVDEDAIFCKSGCKRPEFQLFCL